MSGETRMPALVYVEADDEITDIIDRVRGSEDPEVALVLPGSPRALQNPVNVRLLRQAARNAGKRAVVISGDPRVQELSRASGLPTYGTVAHYERGVELPTEQPRVPVMPVAVPAPPRPTPTTAPLTPMRTGGDRRRPWYYAGIAAAAVGLVLFILLAPAATVNITVKAHQVSKSATIQGSTAQADASKPDHILTAVVKSQQSATFQATPSGTKQIPAANATATLVITDDIDPQQAPAGFNFTVPSADTFTTSDGKQYHPVHDTQVSVPASPGGGQYSQPSTPIQVIASQAGGSGNTGANTITTWTNNPCNPNGPLNPPSPYALPNGCTPKDFQVTNPQAASGGADLQNLTVASDGDLASWTQQQQTLQSQLQQKVQNDENGQLDGRDFAVDPGGGGRAFTCAISPSLPKPGDQFAQTTFTVTCNGAAVVYNPQDVQRVLVADLQKPADQDFVGTPQFSKLAVTQAIADDTGTVILSGSVQAAEERHFDAEALRSQFAGKSPSDVRALIDQTLGPSNVQTVAIQQSPFGLWFLPLFGSRIQVNVLAPTVQGGP